MSIKEGAMKDEELIIGGHTVRLKVWIEEQVDRGEKRIRCHLYEIGSGKEFGHSVVLSYAMLKSAGHLEAVEHALKESMLTSIMAYVGDRLSSIAEVMAHEIEEGHVSQSHALARFIEEVSRICNDKRGVFKTLLDSLTGMRYTSASAATCKPVDIVSTTEDMARKMGIELSAKADKAMLESVRKKLIDSHAMSASPMWKVDERVDWKMDWGEPEGNTLKCKAEVVPKDIEVKEERHEVIVTDKEVKIK
jgi:hypothetical protein